MAPINFEKIPAKLIMENDILSDIVYEDEKITENKKIDHKIRNTPEKDFFMIVLDKKNDKTLGIITPEEVFNWLNSFEKKKNASFKDIMNTSFTTINYKEPITKILNLFESNDKLNVLPIINEEQKYLGKIKRTTLMKRFNELVKLLES